MEFYRDITEVDLFEVTATPLPAYSDTEINCRSELSNICIKEMREKEQTIKSNIDNEENKINKKRGAEVLSAFLMHLIWKIERKDRIWE